MDLRPLPLQLLLEVGARSLQGSMRNAFPGLKRTESGLCTHGVALDTLCSHIHGGKETGPDAIFIDDESTILCIWW